MILQFLLFLYFLSINIYSQDNRPAILDGIIVSKENSDPYIKNLSQKKLRTRLPYQSLQEQLAQIEVVRYNKFINNQKYCKGWSVEDFALAARISGKDADKKWLLDQWELYRFGAYRSYLKTFSDYEERFLIAFEKVDKEYKHPANWHNAGLDHLNCLSSEYRIIKSQREIEEALKQSRLDHERLVASGYQDHYHELDESIDDYYGQLEIFDTYDIQVDRLERRMHAIFAEEASPRFEHKKYQVSDELKYTLWQHQAPAHEYERCYGTELQQVIHQECVDIATRSASLTNDHPAYAYKDALIDLADGARELNKMGKTEKAMSVADVCWGILDCK